MTPDLTRDLHLGIALSFLFGIGLHVVLAFWTLARQRVREEQVFAAANGLLAVSLALQLVEFGVAIGLWHFDGATARGVLGAQLAANLMVLAIFFQLLATFEQRYQRPHAGLRSWFTHQIGHHAHVAVPVGYAVVMLGGFVYLIDAGGVGELMASVRGVIGPTSAYLFGVSLWVLVFVLFPARPGQEHLAVPVAGRAVLLTTLGLTIGLIALWNDQRPRVTQEVLLPLLHLHSVPVAVFLALVRYEFAFMDRFVLGGLRTVVWAVVVLAAYWVFHRVVAFGPELGPLALSVVRIGVLLGALALAPPLARRVSDAAERLMFARRTTPATLRRRFAERLAEGRGLADLIESTCVDVSNALRARGVRVVVGSATAVGREPVQMRVPLTVGGDSVGELLLGDRRDLLPYFDGERRLIDGIAPLLAGAIAAFRRAQPRPVEPEGLDLALASETPPRASSTPTAVPTSRRTWPDPESTLSSRWQSEVLSAATAVSEGDPEAGARILRILERAAAHLRAGGERQVTLEREMEFGRDLLALETLRRGNRMSAAVHFPRPLSDQAVPRGVVLRLMARLIAEPVPQNGNRVDVELRATQTDGRVDLELLGDGAGALRAQFGRRRIRDGAETT